MVRMIRRAAGRGVRGTDIEFEVISPATEDSFVKKFLEQQGPGLHHITIEVPDIMEAAAELRRLGIEPFGGVNLPMGYTTKSDWRDTMVMTLPRVVAGERVRMFFFDVHQQFGNGTDLRRHRGRRSRPAAGLAAARPYSRRRASMGSRCAARRAGR